jgi:hypothetical protein
MAERMGRVLIAFGALLGACLQTIENRGSPEIPREPTNVPETVPAEALTPREPKTCSEAGIEVRKAFERKDDLALATATRTEERLCRTTDATSD